jgi:uncharacterized protein YlxW (UPF0749 family)
VSDDPTKRFDEQGKATQPMLSELLMEVKAMRTEVQDVRAEQREMRASVERRLDRVETELDRLRVVAHETRADFREYLSQQKEVA